jgi:hypothetical protein
MRWNVYYMRWNVYYMRWNVYDMHRQSWLFMVLPLTGENLTHILICSPHSPYSSPPHTFFSSQMATLDKAEALLEELRKASYEAAQKDLKDVTEFASSKVNGVQKRSVSASRVPLMFTQNNTHKQPATTIPIALVCTSSAAPHHSLIVALLCVSLTPILIAHAVFLANPACRVSVRP